ncbi:hypothetical protein [Rhodococcus ruber]|uniref:hypothetical protein n=1 Tax=Rhodococcus ruber TaxID=1830 RepID=UPI00111D0152|nr:hypothetical protein [Rhodococcus ruber]QDC15938.1 hypothetical protein E2561_18970 [Rhodococcus ruber]
MVAAVDEATARSRFAESFIVRLLISTPVLVIGIPIMFLAVERDFFLEGYMGYATAAMIGISANWYFVGRRRPYAMLFLDTMPRIGGLLVGLLIGRSGGSLLSIVACQYLGVLAGAFLSAASIIRRDDLVHLTSGGWPLALRLLREQAAFMWGAFFAVLFAALPITLVSAISQSSLPAFAIVDKVYRQVAAGLSPIVNVFQGWVPATRLEDVKRRSKIAFGVSVTIAISAVAFFAIFGARVFDILGFELGAPSALFAGLLVGAYLVRSMLQLAILPSFRLRLSGRGPVLYGGILGLLLVPPLLICAGAMGAMLAGVLGLIAASVGMAKELRKAVSGGDTSGSSLRVRDAWLESSSSRRV